MLPLFDWQQAGSTQLLTSMAEQALQVARAVSIVFAAEATGLGLACSAGWRIATLSARC